MKFTDAVAIAAMVSAVSAWSGNYTVTTEVVTAYTTYCPEATSFTYGSSTYTVTEATTLTITDCPCTQTGTVAVSPASSLPGVPMSSAPVPIETTVPVVPVPTTPGAPYQNATVSVAPTTSVVVVGSTSVPATSPTSSVEPFPGAAGHVVVNAAAGIAGLGVVFAMIF